MTNRSRLRSPTFRYEYEKPGYGWVKRLASRRQVPDADGEALAAALSAHPGAGGEWIAGGSGGLVAICRSAGAAAEGVAHADVVDALLDVDEGAVRAA